jgi:ABC-2 type transport system ATP-binding protein
MGSAAAVAPIVLVLVAFVAWCIVDIVRRPPRMLPRWVWIVICLASVPLGGILYVVLGRGARPEPSPGSSPEPSPGPVASDADAAPARSSDRPQVAPGGPTAVRVSGLAKVYGSAVALDDVSLDVPHGAVVGLIGPNGAGKTTLLSLLAHLRRPTAGSISYPEPAARVAYLPDTPQFDPWLTAWEVVDLARSLTGVTDPGATEAALERTGLADVSGRRVDGFSRGMLQRLGLAATIVGRPDVFLLDEPCSALDPQGRREVLDLVGGLGGDHTVLFCSHILDDVQEVCDTVAVLRTGRVLFQGPLAELLVGHAAPSYEVRLRSPVEPVVEALRGQTWVRAAEAAGAGRVRVGVTDIEEAERSLAGVLAAAGARVVSIVPASMDLERVFLELTS